MESLLNENTRVDDIHVGLCSEENKYKIENLTQFYFYDLQQCSRYAHYTFKDYGLFEKMPYFDTFWKDKNAYPYLIKKAQLPVGFALIHDLTLNNAANWKMAEFFILAPYRKQGIARRAVRQILKQHPGLWEISVLKDNEIANKFWASILSNASTMLYTQYPEFIVYEMTAA